MDNNNIYHFFYFKPKSFEELLLISNEFSYSMNREPMFKDAFDKAQFEKDERNFLKHNSKNKYYRYFIASFEGAFVGFIFFGLQDKNRKEGFIGELYVKPAYRKNGIAITLLQEAQNWLKAQNCASIELDVPADNKNAIRLYKKIGFLKQKPQMFLFKKNID